MKTFTLIICFIVGFQTFSQHDALSYTRMDSLRGTITPEREWWDILHYDISIRPDYDKKYISGSNLITYKVIQEDHPPVMQIDLKEPMKIDSIIYDGLKRLEYSREGSVFYIKTEEQSINTEHVVTIFFSGNPHVAIRPPWDGGWTFTKDEKGRPWMTVTCQGLGASIWYPNKDHQSDEPDNGASLTMTVQKDLVAVANGKLIETKKNNDNTISYKWAVENPISNYTLIPNIGHYVNFKENYLGLKGDLEINYWVLDYNLEKAKNYMPREVHNMLDSFEYWFGPYPFYEDGYKLIETDNTGMEHQSAVTYGNKYRPGYRGRDGSGTGLGLTWDFIIIHESGHEWFGNNITSNDLADMYIHESFTNYSETLFVDYIYGEEAGNDYNFGTRKSIKNDKPIIAPYGVNAQGSGDMYVKGGNMLHTIRHSMDDDKLFRNILNGLNLTFHNKTVDGRQIQDYISQKAEYDYTKVFYQYLNTTHIPELHLYVDGPNNKIHYKWGRAVAGFNLPLSLKGEDQSIRITPSDEWQSIEINPKQQYLFNPSRIEKMYLLNVQLVDSINE